MIPRSPSARRPGATGSSPRLFSASFLLISRSIGPSVKNAAATIPRSRGLSFAHELSATFLEEGEPSSCAQG